MIAWRKRNTSSSRANLSFCFITNSSSLSSRSCLVAGGDECLVKATDLTSGSSGGSRG